MNAKTIRYLPQGGAEVIEIDVPEPGPNEVQVAGSACGICAWDLYTFRHGAEAPFSAPPGHEAIGRIVKVGEAVDGLKVGQRVAGGGFATLYNLPAQSTHVLPESDLDDVYWTVEPVSCIVTGLDHCRIQAGDRVILIGCGFMGLLLLQGLLRSLARQVVAVDMLAQRRELARQLGAELVFDPAADAEKLEALAPFDIVVDATGAQAAVELSSQLAKSGGRYVLFGWNHGPTTFPGDVWHLKGLTVVNASPASKIRDPFPPAAELIAAGIIDTRPLVTHVVSLDELPDLLDRVTSGREPDYVKGIVRLN